MATLASVQIQTKDLPDVVVVPEKSRADWDRFVQEDTGVIAWHSYEWAKLLGDLHHTKFYPLAVYDGSKISGILPLYRVKTYRGESLISVPYFVAGGVVSSSADVRTALLNKAISLSRELNIPKVTLKQYKLKLEGQLVTDENYYNRELTLSPDLDKVRHNLSKLNREKIEESRACRTTFDYPCSDVSAFYKLLLHDQHSLGVPCVSRAWIAGLYNTGMYEIALLRHSGEIVAGTMVKKFKHTVSFPFTCLSKHSERAHLFGYSLYWQLIETLARQGITIMHSGRIPKTDAAIDFRLGWGGTKYNYYYQYYGVSPAATEFKNKRNRKRQLIESVWKRMPVALAQAAGPFVVKQFP